MAFTNPNNNPAGLDILQKQITGIVQNSFYESTMLRDVFTINKVVNGRTLTTKRIGRATVQVFDPATPIVPTARAVGEVSVTIDRLLLSRESIPRLHEVQNDFNVLSRLAGGQGEALAEDFDRALFTQVMKGARTTGAQLDGYDLGSVTSLSGAGSELDPAKLEAAISAMGVKMDEKNVSMDRKNTDICIYLPPAQYSALLSSDRIYHKDLNPEGNGSFASGVFTKMGGFKVKKTNLLPTSVVTGSTLGNAFNVSAAEAKVVGMAFGRDALLVGESISLTSKVWYEDKDKMHYVDSELSFNATPNRLSLCNVIDKP